MSIKCFNCGEDHHIKDCDQVLETIGTVCSGVAGLVGSAADTRSAVHTMPCAKSCDVM